MNFEPTQEIIFPSYKETLGKIKNHILDRKVTVITRTFLISLPGIIYVGLFYFFMRSWQDGNLFVKIWVSFYVVLPFILTYTLSFTHLFFIEKYIWVDSYFDNQDIDIKASYKIAKKLFWRSLLVRFQLFFKYYLIPVIIFLLSLTYIAYVFYKFTPMSTPGSAIPRDFNPNWNLLRLTITCSIFILCLNWLYFYYLKVKLRFFWFIFLDNYGRESSSFKTIIKEMNKFNSVNQYDSFKKSLIINFGADIAESVINSTTISFLRLIKGKNKYAETAALMIKLSLSEVTNQFASLSKITGNYVMYQYIRYFYYQNTQSVNKNIYKLSDR